MKQMWTKSMKIKSAVLVIIALIFLFVFNNVDIFAAKAEKKMDLVNYQTTPNPIFKLQSESTPTPIKTNAPTARPTASILFTPSVSPSVSPSGTPKASPSIILSPTPTSTSTPTPTHSSTLTPQALISGN